MADNRPGGQPTEPPSEKKLRDARRRGQVARSRDLTSTVVFLAVVGVLAGGWPWLIGRLRETLTLGLETATVPGASATAALQQGLSTLGMLLAPLMVAAVGAALIAGVGQTGPLLALKAVSPDLGRLSPVRNVKNVVGKAALFELFKSLIKVGGIGYVAYAVLEDHLPGLLGLAGKAPEQAMLVVGGCLWAVALRVSILMLALSVLDVVYQRHSHRKRLMMTKGEVKRELKESEGDPQRKAERMRIHREIIDHQTLEAVATADCVIINPDRLAVAVRYDEEVMGAPRVVARGHRLAAARIKQIARQHGIPIIRNVPLARALIELEVDDEIPGELYEAVAEVLRFVHRLSSPGAKTDER